MRFEQWWISQVGNIAKSDVLLTLPELKRTCELSFIAGQSTEGRLREALELLVSNVKYLAYQNDGEDGKPIYNTRIQTRHNSICDIGSALEKAEAALADKEAR